MAKGDIIAIPQKSNNMNKDFMQEKGFGDWHKILDSTYSIMGSDDIDSWGGRYVLKEKFGIDMDFFFDFKTVYKREDLDTSTMTKKNIIGVDIDLVSYKCFGNHPTYLQNEDAINLNKGIPYGCQGYYSKFAGSSLLTIMSLFDIPLWLFTEKELEVLLCVDVGFKQYFYNDKTRELFKYYYDEVLQYPEFIEVVKDKDKDYFYNIIKEYKLYEKIRLNEEGYLETEIELDRLSELFGIDLSLPKHRFITEFEMQSIGKPLHIFNRVNKDKIFSSAVTNCNYVKASIKF